MSRTKLPIAQEPDMRIACTEVTLPNEMVGEHGAQADTHDMAILAGGCMHAR